MPATHSSFTCSLFLANLPLLPLNSKIKGPAPFEAYDDPINEAISLFRPNCFFRNFNVDSPADRLLIYLSLFIQELLSKLKPNLSQIDALRAFTFHAVSNFSIPGDAAFPLNAIFEAPKGSENQGILF